MPGDGSVQILENAVTGHEGFACAAFFAGATVEDDSAGQFTGCDGFLDGDGSAQRTGAQQVVAAALTVAASLQR